MMENMPKIASRSELLGLGVPTENVPVPELGEGVEIVVKGYTVSDILQIQELSITKVRDPKTGAFIRDKDGNIETQYDGQQDVLMSVICAVKTPELTIADTTLILNWPPGVTDRICAVAASLGGRSQSAYEQFKELLRRNGILRRLYSFCAQHGRLPSEIEKCSEREFMMAIAALELDAEDAQASTDENKTTEE